MKKIAVFSTTDIFTTRSKVMGKDGRSWLLLDKKAHIVDGPSIRQFYSTGRLEKALAEGYTVLVGSARTRFGQHDMWWIGLVGGIENVYFSMPHGHENHNEMCGNGYHRIFERLEIPWPLEKDGKRVFWSRAIHDLAPHIKQGHEFKPGKY